MIFDSRAISQNNIQNMNKKCAAYINIPRINQYLFPDRLQVRIHSIPLCNRRNDSESDNLVTHLAEMLVG